MNEDQPNIHHRHSIRLKGFDYAQAGAYYVTICSHDRQCLFGDIIDGEMQINQFGEIVGKAWTDLPNHYPHLELDRFVVMPNHVHGVVVFVGAGLKPAPTNAGLKPGGNICDDAKIVGAGFKPAPTPAPAMDKRHGLPEIVRAFKTFSARHINENRNSPGVTVWQRNYYEHIIRDDDDYNRIAEYIDTNPQKWIDDKLHPDAKGFKPGGNICDDAEIVGAGFKHGGNICDDGNIVGAGFKPAPTTVAQRGGHDE